MEESSFGSGAVPRLAVCPGKARPGSGRISVNFERGLTISGRTMPLKLPARLHEELQGARNRLRKAEVLVGFDGFVDTILHVVDKRESATRYTRLEKMENFAARIKSAAGLSANFEFVTQMVKLGGNGPIMANAIGAYGSKVTYIGNLGDPVIHPVFDDFNRRAVVHSVAEPGYTDAVEFTNGKLMCGKHASLREINWATLTRHVAEEKLFQIFSDAALIAMVNWTMLPHMNQIFSKILSRIAPRLQGEKRLVFFDLADPEKRTREDLAGVLRLISKFEKHFRAILGLNFRESCQIGEVLGIKAPKMTEPAVKNHAAAIREKLGIDTVVVHPTAFAAAAEAGSSSVVTGPFTEKPKITTGAGDHFNAGFCLGRLLKLDLEMSLQLGVATSGFYVRQATSPRLEDVKRFLQTL